MLHNRMTASAPGRSACLGPANSGPIATHDKPETFLPVDRPAAFRKMWCPRSDSNRHASRRRILSPLRLPFHHSGLVALPNWPHKPRQHRRMGNRPPNSFSNLVACPSSLRRQPLSRIVHTECVAVRQLSRLQTGLKPARPLRARAMGKAFRHRNPAGIALQRVVADLLGSIDRLFEIALLDRAERSAAPRGPRCRTGNRPETRCAPKCRCFRSLRLRADLVGLAKDAKSSCTWWPISCATT